MVSHKFVTIPVTGLTCVNCALAIEAHLKKLPGIQKANVEIASETITVTFDPSQISESDIITCIENFGYFTNEKSNTTETPKNHLEVEKIFSELFRKSPVSIIISVPYTGLIIDANEKFIKDMEFTRDEVIGHTTIDLDIYVSLLERDQVLNLLRKDSTVLGHECTFRSKTGKIQVGLWSVTLFTINDETYQLSTIVDITDRKRDEEVKNARTRLVKFAFDHSLDELLEETLNEVEKLTGSLIGFYHFVDPDQNSLTLQNWSSRTKKEYCKAEGKGLHYAIAKAGVWVDCVTEKKPIIHNDYASLPHKKGMPEGHSILIRELVVPVMRGEKVTAILGIGNKPIDYDQNDINTVSLLADIAWDIAERKRTEEALQKKEQEYRSLIENLPAGVVVHAADTSIILSNPMASTILGLTEDQLHGKTAMDPAWHFIKYDETPTPLEEYPVNRVVLSGKPIASQVIGIRKSGFTETTWAMCNAYPVYDSNNVLLQVVVTFIDITEIKRAEKETLMLNELLEQRVAERTAQLEASNKELEAFSYSVSHDLRAPLRHISGYVNLLHEHCLDSISETGRHYLDTISDSTNQMGTLIDDLLQFSRTGRKEMHLMCLDMNSVFKEAMETLKYDVHGRTIQWIIPDLPEVFADNNLLRLVWENLLSNAIKFTGQKKEACIEIGFREDTSEFLFFIRDNGVGFDMKYSAKLFGVFQRLHSVCEFKGTGIGLANVQRIINKHGGKTWADAVLGNGATIYFTLPKHKEVSQ